MNATVTLEVPEEALRLFDGDASTFSREMYVAAVVKWYDEGRISSGQGARMLAVSRADFLDLLFRHKVSPFQYTPEELAAEMKS